MDYQKIYDQLIERARNRVPEGYVERHHVIPRCMGGADKKENLVALYPEEHFTAHALLLKIYKNTEHRFALAKAVQKMTVGHKGKRARKLYGWLKREFALAQSECQSGRGNSQFGSRWISNIELQENRKIKKTESIPDGWIAGRNKWKKKPVSHKRKDNVIKREQEVLSVLQESSSISEAIRKCGLQNRGANYATFKRVIVKYDLQEKFSSEKIKWDCVPSWSMVADS